MTGQPEEHGQYKVLIVTAEAGGLWFKPRCSFLYSNYISTQLTNHESKIFEKNCVFPEYTYNFLIIIHQELQVIYIAYAIYLYTGYIIYYK